MKWLNNHAEILKTLPDKYRDWLTKPHCLTRAFEERAGRLTLKRISEGCNERFFEDEQSAFVEQSAEIGDTPYVRRVLFLGGGNPWYYARVIVAEQTYQHFKKAFDTLGDRFLGETLLYPRNDLKRSDFSYALCLPDSAVGQEVQSASQLDLTEPFWARRSMFWMGGFPLLVSEFFMPEVPGYADP